MPILGAKCSFCGANEHLADQSEVTAGPHLGPPKQGQVLILRNEHLAIRLRKAFAERATYFGFVRPGLSGERFGAIRPPNGSRRQPDAYDSAERPDLEVYEAGRTTCGRMRLRIR